MKTYVLSLGSNLAPRMDHLRSALFKISQFAKICKVSPAFENPPLLPPDAPKSWYQFFLNTAIQIETELSPLELLKKIKSVELDCGRPQDHLQWSPRSLDIDIIFELSKKNELLSFESQELKIPHSSWALRNFVLTPLVHLLGGEHPELNLLQKHRGADQPLTAFVAILNVTPDSFSETAEHKDADSLLKKFRDLLEIHPAAIDIGAESTRPGATPVDPKEEWLRLEPVLNYYREHKHLFPFTRLSLDTRHAVTAQKALDYNVTILNDVSGLQDPAMREVAEHFQSVVLMHSLTVPADPRQTLPPHSSPTAEVVRWMQQQLESLTTTLQKKIILDPGIGFGKTPLQSLELLKNVRSFYQFKQPLLIGHSRKSFMNLWTQKEYGDRDFETLGVSASLFGSIEFLRVHNLEAHQRMAQSLLALGAPT